MEEVKKQFKPVMIKEPPVGLPFENINGQWFFKDVIRTKNFIRDKRGLEIDPHIGQLESGDLKMVGGSMVGGMVIIVKPGQDIQGAVNRVNDAGGGIVFLTNGTHVRTADLVLYSRVYLQGQTVTNCGIDFQGNTGIIIQGTDVYNTGTVSIGVSDTTVVGVGTNWTSSMAGRHIHLNGMWYLIDSVTDATHLELNTNYMDDDLSGASYVISTIKYDVRISDLTITGDGASNDAIINARYVDTLVLSHLVTGLSGNRVLYIRDSSFVFLNDVTALYATAVCNIEFGNVYHSKLNFVTCALSFLIGLSFGSCSRISVKDSFVYGCLDRGIDLSGCDNIDFNDVYSKNNGLLNTAEGFNCLIACTDIKFANCVAKNNSGDGFKLTGTIDYSKLSNCISRDNGAYGINIAAATCDKNIIANCTTNGNTSGDINNLGTGTVQDNNVT